jgi:hypothetical protein
VFYEMTVQVVKEVHTIIEVGADEDAYRVAARLAEPASEDDGRVIDRRLVGVRAIDLG